MALMYAIPASAITVAFEPSQDLNSLGVGDNFSIDLRASTGPGESISGFTLSLSFTSDTLQFDNVSFNPGLNVPFVSSPSGPVDGITTIPLISGAAFFTPPITGDDVTLATFEFSTLATDPGMISFAASNPVLGIITGTGSNLPINGPFQNFTNIPLPAPVFLLIASIVSLMSFRKSSGKAQPA
ncbi:MAG: hypothetical protein AAGE80_13685 [Pseudomonadota bacterium]